MREGTSSSHGLAHLVAELGEHAPSAVDYVVAELYSQHPQLMERFGEAGKKHCRNDIAYQLEFLTAAIGAGASQPFTSYVQWAKRLLEARNVPTASLRESLDILTEFLRQHASTELAEKAQPVLDDAKTAFDTTTDAGALSLRHMPAPRLKLERLVSSLVRGRHEDVLGLIRGALHGESLYIDVAVHVIQPAMYDVGRLWHEREVSVAQEHLATATSQYVLSEILLKQQFAEPSGRTAVIACVEANHHTLGARMLADAMMISGWDTQFLGANTPTRDLVEHVDEHRPDLLALSVSMPQQLETVRRLIEQMRTEMGASTPTIMVGGLAMNQLDGLWKRFGADIWIPDVELAMAEIA